MATCELDSDSRILRWSWEDMFGDILENPEYIDENFVDSLSDFLWEDGSVRFEPAQAVANAREVAQLKANLAATDYIACKIAEGAATAEEYAVQIAQRAAWRERINELENETQTGAVGEDGAE